MLRLQAEAPATPRRQELIFKTMRKPTVNIINKINKETIMKKKMNNYGIAIIGITVVVFW